MFGESIRSQATNAGIALPAESPRSVGSSDLEMAVERPPDFLLPLCCPRILYVDGEFIEAEGDRDMLFLGLFHGVGQDDVRYLWCCLTCNTQIIATENGITSPMQVSAEDLHWVQVCPDHGLQTVVVDFKYTPPTMSWCCIVAGTPHNGCQRMFRQNEILNDGQVRQNEILNDGQVRQNEFLNGAEQETVEDELETMIDDLGVEDAMHDAQLPEDSDAAMWNRLADIVRIDSDDSDNVWGRLQSISEY